MPYINSYSSLESTVTGWQKRDVRRKNGFPIFKPRHPTSDLIDYLHPKTRLYRGNLSPAQIYSGTSRGTHMKLLQTALNGLPSDIALQVRWRPSSETPAFSMPFLRMYLTRKYGKVAAIYQQAINSCLVVFEDTQSAYTFSRDPEKGSPHGRLYARWWRPQPQDNTYFQVLKHIEKAAETKFRFNEMMDRVDRDCLVDTHHAFSDPMSVRADRLVDSHLAFSRAMSIRNKIYGPSMLPVLARPNDLKDLFKVIKAEKENKSATPQPEPKEVGGIKLVTKHSEFELCVGEAREVVVKFFAKWCSPCSMIAPEIERLSRENPDVTFISVDVDENEDTADFCNITVLPTLQFFIRGRLVDEVRGNAVELIETKIRSMQRNSKKMS